MSLTFTKLFSSITESTVWCEPHATRIVWVTLLAMADRRGRVWSSIPGLMGRARVSREECNAALARFMAPDPDSRTPDDDGRRIEAIDGGWRLLNHQKYRDMRDEEARLENKREWDRKHRPSGAARGSKSPTKSDKSDKVRPSPSQAEAEAYTERTPKPIVAQGATGPARAIANRVLTYLNERAGTHFRPGTANVKLILARIKYDGATEDEMRKVIDAKTAEVKAGEFEAKYLRPATLFNAEKWAQYSGQVGMGSVLPAAAPTSRATLVSVYGLNGASALPVSLFSSNVPFAPDKVDPLKIAKRVWANNRALIEKKFPKEPPTAIVIEWNGERRTFKVNELT